MIYTFWEGKMPEYIKLCMNTWKFPYQVLNYDNLYEYTDMPIEKAKRFTLPQIADCVRVHVLRDNGGYWLDADTISITGEFPECVILGNPKLRTNSIGYLHTKPQTEMFVKWAAYQDEILNREDTPRHWATMGNAFTDEYLEKHKEIAIGQISDCFPETYMVKGTKNRRNKYKEFYFEYCYHLDDIHPTDLLMLHNSWTPQWYKELRASEVLNKQCTLSNILRELS